MRNERTEAWIWKCGAGQKLSIVDGKVRVSNPSAVVMTQEKLTEYLCAASGDNQGQCMDASGSGSGSGTHSAEREVPDL